MRAKSLPTPQTKEAITSSFRKPILLHATGSNSDAPVSLPEEAVSVINFEELMGKDWSVLDYDKFSPNEEFNRNIDRIISAGMIEETSRVLVSISSEEFVDRLVDSSPCKFLLVVHDSLLMLAGIKERYDLVKCWQEKLYMFQRNGLPWMLCFFISCLLCSSNLTRFWVLLLKMFSRWKGGYRLSVILKGEKY